ncbi:hypothetical protein [Streptomyces virginiae]|uniref:hypothetical protein n=1 Tax=Streptomyces virginiae TaxID=1961 RepID=UPI00365C47D3
MFIRRSTYRRLAARAEAYAQAYVDAQRARHRKTPPAVERRNRLVQACARYRAELAAQRTQHAAELAAQRIQHAAALAAQQRRIDYLQEQVDEVLGLNSEQVRAGARWQQRRPDKPRPVAK